MKLQELLEASTTNINKLSDDEQIDIINKSTNFNVLASIKKPSQRVKLAAIHHNFQAIEFIKNPNEVEQMACLDAVAQYANDPTDYGFINVHHDTFVMTVLVVLGDTGEVIELFKNPTTAVLKRILAEPLFINATKFDLYDNFVRYHFKDNVLLMNKWLRYAKNIRGA